MSKYSLFCPLAALVFAGCGNDFALNDDVSNSKDNTVFINAIIENEDSNDAESTRTYIYQTERNKHKVFWIDSDEITVFDDSNTKIYEEYGSSDVYGTRFTLSSGSHREEGQFTGNLEGNFLYALYPHNENNIYYYEVLDDGTVEEFFDIYLPEEYDYTEGKVCTPMLSKYYEKKDDTIIKELKFQHIAGSILFEIYNLPDNVKEVTLTTPSSQIAGHLYIDKDKDGSFYISSIYSDHDQIKLKIDRANGQAIPTKFYFPLPLRNYHRGLKLEYTDSDGNTTLIAENTQPFTIKKGDMACYPIIYLNTETIIDGHEAVLMRPADPENGVKALYVAKNNIGAENQNLPGTYFFWGETSGHTIDADFTSDDCLFTDFIYEGQENTTTKNKSIEDLKKEGIIDDNNNLTQEYDAAHVNWGGIWKMPTAKDIDWLCDSINSQMMVVNKKTPVTLPSIKDGEKVLFQKKTITCPVPGLLVRSKKTGGIVFFPNTGFGFFSSVINLMYEGEYWSATVEKQISEAVKSISFANNIYGKDVISEQIVTDVTDFNRFEDYLHPIRPFCEK